MQTTDRGFAGSRPVLPPRAMEVLQIIGENSGMTCTGSCHHQKKEFLHCRQIGKMLEMGFSAVWDRIGFLLSKGYLKMEKVDGGPVKFILTDKGEEALRFRSLLQY